MVLSDPRLYHPFQDFQTRILTGSPEFRSEFREGEAAKGEGVLTVRVALGGGASVGGGGVLAVRVGGGAVRGTGVRVSVRGGLRSGCAGLGLVGHSYQSVPTPLLLKSL